MCLVERRWVGGVSALCLVERMWVGGWVCFVLGGAEVGGWWVCFVLRGAEVGGWCLCCGCVGLQWVDEQASACWDIDFSAVCLQLCRGLSLSRSFRCLLLLPF